MSHDRFQEVSPNGSNNRERISHRINGDSPLDSKFQNSNNLSFSEILKQGRPQIVRNKQNWQAPKRALKMWTSSTNKNRTFWEDIDDDVEEDGYMETVDYVGAASTASAHRQLPRSIPNKGAKC